MKLRLNREFAIRHIFVTVLLVAMGAWFAYDGYVTYPSLTPEELYQKIEKSEAPSHEAAVKLYESAVPRQKQFMSLCFVGALIVGLGVLKAWRFSFEYDETGFTWRGRRMGLSDIESVDESQWKKKGILKLKTSAGVITLDSWHNTGVDGFYELVRKGK